jgi:hypothetical protein
VSVNSPPFLGIATIDYHNGFAEYIQPGEEANPTNFVLLNGSLHRLHLISEATCDLCGVFTTLLLRNSLPRNFLVRRSHRSPKRRTQVMASKRIWRLKSGRYETRFCVWYCCYTDCRRLRESGAKEQERRERENNSGEDGEKHSYRLHRQPRLRKLSISDSTGLARKAIPMDGSGT